MLLNVTGFDSSRGTKRGQQAVRAEPHLFCQYLRGTLTNTFLAVLVAAAVCEAAKQFAFPHITLLQMNVIMAFLFAAASTVAVCLALRRQTEFLARVQTQLAECQRAAAEEAKTLAAILESSEHAIVAKTLDGTIIFWNQGARRLYGYCPEEVIGRSISILAPPDRADEVPGILKRIKQREKLSHFETVQVRKDGTAIDVSLSISPLQNASGEVIGTATIAHDVTQRKQAERELKAAREAAEAASRAQSEFLAEMSHEMRAPMNAIMGMTELALDTPLSSEQRYYLTMVKDSADSLLTLLNDGLDFSRIEAGKLSLDTAEFDLYDVLANALRSLSFRASQKGLEIAWSAKPEVPERLFGDAGRIRQVIVNLVGNAIKFTEQGEVVVGVEVESRREQNILLHFTVRDTGIGVTPEKQKSIFEAFTQADGSMRPEFAGTGLGLRISARLVQMMLGRIWLESVPGEGSTFHFTAQFGVAKGERAEAPSRQGVSLRGLPVLVVDDNSTNRKILDAMLKHWFMQPELACGGSEGLLALDRAASAGMPFPLVILDYQMPEMDGFSMAKRIKQNPRLAGACIMMLTSAGERGDVARCRELGIAVYLVKPIRQSELLEGILAALGKSPTEGSDAAVITRHKLREDRRKLQILLAEDNAVNQQLAVRLLEKRGHLVKVASDGSEALALWKQLRFDLALMDVQMPGMDGFETTAAIRKEEAVSGKHLPIIAMTAHALEGDRGRCLAAGMDAYISKPIHADELTEMVESIAGLMFAKKAMASASLAVFDRGEALSRFHGDQGLLADLAEVFLKNSPSQWASICGATEQGDLAGPERAAHSLKGSIASFGARRTYESALELEKTTRSGDLAECSRLRTTLEAEMEALKPELLRRRRDEA